MDLTTLMALLSSAAFTAADDKDKDKNKKDEPIPFEDYVKRLAKSDQNIQSLQEPGKDATEEQKALFESQKENATLKLSEALRAEDERMRVKYPKATEAQRQNIVTSFREGNLEQLISDVELALRTQTEAEDESEEVDIESGKSTGDKGKESKDKSKPKSVFAKGREAVKYFNEMK